VHHRHTGTASGEHHQLGLVRAEQLAHLRQDAREPLRPAAPVAHHVLGDVLPPEPADGRDQERREPAVAACLEILEAYVAPAELRFLGPAAHEPKHLRRAVLVERRGELFVRPEGRPHPLDEFVVDQGAAEAGAHRQVPRHEVGHEREVGRGGADVDDQDPVEPARVAPPGPAVPDVDEGGLGLRDELDGQPHRREVLAVRRDRGGVPARGVADVHRAVVPDLRVRGEELGEEDLGELHGLRDDQPLRIGPRLEVDAEVQRVLRQHRGLADDVPVAALLQGFAPQGRHDGGALGSPGVDLRLAAPVRGQPAQGALPVAEVQADGVPDLGFAVSRHGRRPRR
jgi:hypothetical protein